MHKPRVSVCTPTGNRAHFLPQALRNILHQTYPRELIEWVLVDDSTDEESQAAAREIAARGRAEGLVVVLIEMESPDPSARIPLGRKRNLTHSHSSGTILVHMDDDDFYPPTRISHAVDRLLGAMKRDPSVLLAGSSELLVWFLVDDTVYRFGPHGPRHATAATLAFHRDLLRKGARFEDDKTRQEEPSFLQNFTLPMVQLDPYLTILAVSHSANTVDRAPIVQRAERVDDPEKTRIARSSLGSGRKLLKKDRDSIAFYANLMNRAAGPATQST